MLKSVRFKGWSAAGFTLAAVMMVSALGAFITPSHAAQIRYVVNNTPITSYDLDRRTALLRLMQRRGNLREIAAEEMIDQTLRLTEMSRVGINITPAMLNDAYANFAAGNKMSTAQLDQFLSQQGVTPDHFKGFIRTQIGWGRAVQMRAGGGSGERMTEQEAVRRMLQQGGQKPTATEYVLQQVIFVVPPAQRGQIMARRKREAQAMRDRFNGCSNTANFAKGLIDVTVKDLGRKLALELPPEWKDQISKARPGTATPIRETEMGVEFIGVCSSREVSDDHVARLVFESQQQGQSNPDFEKASKDYTDELRKKASIQRR